MKLLLPALLLLCGCGDLLGYTIGHGGHGQNADADQPTWPDQGVTWQVVVPGPSPDAALSIPVGCRPPAGFNPDLFCSGDSPKALVDFQDVPLRGIRARGTPSLRFQFLQLDAPRQIVAELGASGASGALPPGKHPLTDGVEDLETRIYPVSCGSDADCPAPTDWISAKHGDLVGGWFDLHPDGSSDRAGLCVAAARGLAHAPGTALPCSVVLYAPPVPIQ